MSHADPKHLTDGRHSKKAMGLMTLVDCGLCRRNAAETDRWIAGDGP